MRAPKISQSVPKTFQSVPKTFQSFPKEFSSVPLSIHIIVVYGESTKFLQNDIFRSQSTSGACIVLYHQICWQSKQKEQWQQCNVN